MIILLIGAAFLLGGAIGYAIGLRDKAVLRGEKPYYVDPDSGDSLWIKKP